jgi:hypothetical protein
LTVDVVPYSYAASPQAVGSLEALLGRALGGNVSVALAPAVAYGNEDAAAPAAQGAPRALRVALFNATATPEREAHGRFLATLARSGGTWVALVDEASFNARVDDPGRRETRRALWRDVAGASGIEPLFVDLADPDLSAAERALDAALDAAAA